MELKMAVEGNFNLEKAVCNYGFFMMSPNQWNTSSKTLRRPLRLADGSTSVTVSISQPSSENHIFLHLLDVHSLAVSDQEAIQRQVVRMLRISKKDEEDVRKFQEMQDEARKTNFGRLFRSPDLFEDIVKTILLCNTTWQRTLQMSRALCELQAELCTDVSVAQTTIPDFFRKRKRETTLTPCERTSKPTNGEAKTSPKVEIRSVGNFPSSKELAGLSAKLLETRCHLGYRAKYIINLAKMVEEHKLRLQEFENQPFTKTLSQNYLKRLKKFKGIGEFSAANILMCVGDYRNIPIDSETINHLSQVHGRKICKKNSAKMVVKEVYDRFAPYQSLAYWFEHVEFYEKQLGEEMSKLSPSSYRKVSGSYLSNSTPEKRKKTLQLLPEAAVPEAPWARQSFVSADNNAPSKPA